MGRDQRSSSEADEGPRKRSKEGIAKGRTGADGPVVPAGCHLCLPPFHISFKKNYLWAGMGLPGPRTSVVKLSLRNLQPRPLSNMREMSMEGMM